MPVLFLFQLSALFSPEMTMVFIKADVDILLVHARKFGCHFEGIFVSATLIAGAPAPMLGKTNSDRKRELRFSISPDSSSGSSSWRLSSTISEGSSVPP
jgi:hypothetical protein